MIVPQGKKCLICSLGQFKLLLPKEKLTSPRNNELPPRKVQVPKGNICSEFYNNKVISFFIYINLQPIIRKVSKRTTTLWLEGLQSERCKSYDHTKSRTHLFPRGHGYSPKVHNLNCSPKEQDLGFSSRKLLPWGPTMCPREQPKPCFFKKQMCLKLCVIITFASKF
jgi:hypothetical protein